jgi:hypothetical protein
VAWHSWIVWSASPQRHALRLVDLVVAVALCDKSPYRMQIKSPHPSSFASLGTWGAPQEGYGVLCSSVRVSVKRNGEVSKHKVQKQREERPRWSCCSAGPCVTVVAAVEGYQPPGSPRVRTTRSVPSASQVGRNHGSRLARNCYLPPPPALFLSPEQTDAHGPKTGMEKARKEEKTTPEQPTLTAPKPLFKHAHSPVTQAARCPPKPPYPNERSRGEPRTEEGTSLEAHPFARL